MASVYTILFKDKTDNRKVKKQLDDLTMQKGASKERVTGGDHTRYMRPVNSVMNRVTGGYWEQGTRLAKASVNVVDNYKQGGFKQAVGSVGVMIIVQYLIIQFMKWWDNEKKLAKQENDANFLAMVTGQTRLSEGYSVAKKVWNGKITFKNQ